MLFPELSAADYAELKEDIRLHGVKVPILVHGGQILDGRHRYRACRELGVRCLMVEWNGFDPWIEVQSRNLVRRHLAKDQVYAIRKLAAQQFPELAKAIEAERENAKARKAQAKGQPRGQKALPRSEDRRSSRPALHTSSRAGKFRGSGRRCVPGQPWKTDACSRKPVRIANHYMLV